MKHKQYIIAGIFFVSLTLGACAQDKPRPAGVPADAKILKNLEYVKDGHERNKLDLYLPKAEGKVPLIIWVHGGGWMGGSKDGPNPALPFVAKGYAVASINYRYSQQAIYPAQIEDCKAAVRWLRAHAKEYNLDPDHFGAWGASAGGHLVALLGTAGDVKELEGKGGNLDQSSRVQAVVDWYGPINFLNWFPPDDPRAGKSDGDTPDNPLAKLVGGKVSEKKELVAKANPITYVTKDDAPFLILHGDKDPLVPVHQSKLLEAALKKAGVDATLIVVKDAGHDGKVSTPETRKQTEEFFAKYLKKSEKK